MEGILVIGGALLAAVSALIVTSEGSESQDGARELRRVRVRAFIRRALSAASGLRLVRRLLARGAWRDLADRLVGRASEQGCDLTREEVGAALVTFCGFLTLLGGVAAGSLVGLVVVGGLCVIGAHLLETSYERRQARELSASMPGVFRTLAVALGSGQTLSQAIDYVGSHEKGLVAREFARTSLRLRCGVNAREALSQMADELEAPGIGLIVTALLISQRTGSPLRDLFQRSARLVERQGEFERTLSVKTAQVRLSVRIVCLLPVLMIAVLSLLSRDFQEGLSSPAGMVCIVLALVMDSVALLIIRHLMRGVL